LLHAWRKAFGDAPTMIRDAVSRSELYNTTDVDLREVLREVAEERGEINRRRLGRWIARHQGRIVDELRFERDSGTSSAERWRAKTVIAATTIPPAASVMSVSTVAEPQAAQSVDMEEADCEVEL